MCRARTERRDRIQNPLVICVLWYNDRGVPGGGHPTMQSYNPFSWFTSDMCFSRFHISQMNGDYCEHREANPV